MTLTQSIPREPLLCCICADLDVGHVLRQHMGHIGIGVKIYSLEHHLRSASVMSTTFSCSHARRRLRRLFALVAQGQSFVIRKNGRVICRLEGAKAIQVAHGAAYKASL
jgi:hypothetical protein